MRIGIDAACWSNQRGYGRYTRELLKALVSLDRTNEYVFFLDPETSQSDDFPEGITRRLLDVTEAPSRAASADGRRSLSDMWKMGSAVRREPLDMIFFPSVYTYFPVFNSVKKIMVIHDVIPEQFPELVFTNRKSRFFWNLKVWAAIKQAELILTVSEFSKKGIMDIFKIPDHRIRVATEAADKVFRPIHEKDKFKEKLAPFNLDPSTRFILYVGGIAPHKNLSVLVNACSRLIEDPAYRDVKLLLVGDFDQDSFLIDYRIKDQIEKLGLTDTVIFAGYVADSELVYLYNAAKVLVLPSFCEGFGLPALEAMSCGTPAIASETTSLPEVVGDAGLFFDPKSPDELLDRLTRVLGNSGLREELEKRSIQRAVTFSWQKTASKVLTIFNELGKDVQAA